MVEQESELFAKVMEVVRRDPRYKLDAYLFVFEALDFTVKEIVRERRHVSGRELLEGIRRLGLKHFGPLAKSVFGSWGVRETIDFGNIVFNLVNSGLMGKTEQDSVEDFRDVFRFEDAFRIDDLFPPTRPK